MTFESAASGDPEAFRQELRTWMTANIPDGLVSQAPWNASPNGPKRGLLEAATDSAEYRLWEQRLREERLICPAWPQAYGGQALGAAELAVLNEEFYLAGVPRVQRGMGETLLGPAVIVHGTEEQRQRFLPGIIAGTDRYCQGFSEPDHGSDLAGVQTSAMVDGDELVINGSKVWTSGAHRANYMFLLCRTDPSAPRHKGLTYVIVPMQDNNIELQPIRQITGSSEFCQEYFHDARAPLANVIGEVGEGWRVAMTTLGNERGSRVTLQHLMFQQELDNLLELAKNKGLQADPVIRQRLAQAFSEVQIMRFSGLRLLAAMAAARPPGPEASLSKLQYSEYHRRFGELAADLRGAESMLRPDGPGYQVDDWLHLFLSTRAGTIYAGSSEIQRNIIAERVLGLPR